MQGEENRKRSFSLSIGLVFVAIIQCISEDVFTALKEIWFYKIKGYPKSFSEWAAAHEDPFFGRPLLTMKQPRRFLHSYYSDHWHFRKAFPTRFSNIVDIYIHEHGRPPEDFHRDQVINFIQSIEDMTIYIVGHAIAESLYVDTSSDKIADRIYLRNISFPGKSKDSDFSVSYCCPDETLYYGEPNAYSPETAEFDIKEGEVIDCRRIS